MIEKITKSKVQYILGQVCFAFLNRALNFTIIGFVFFNTSVFGQDHYRSSWIFGITGGGTNSCIDKLDKIILSEPNFINYSLVPKWKNGYTGGIFLNFRESNFAGQLEAVYSQQGSTLLFHNYEKDFNYKMDFNYQYLNINPILKFYFGDFEAGNDEENKFGKRLNVSLGLRISFDFLSKISYRSGGSGYLPAFGTDEQQEQQLNNVLKANINTGLILGVGYEIKNLAVDLRYNTGIGNIVSVEANSYNFNRKDNKNTFYQATISYYFNID